MVALGVRASRCINKLILLFVLLLVSGTAIAQQQILIGSNEIRRNVDSNSAGMAEAFPMVASASGQVNYLSVFVDSTNTAATIWVGIYASYSGRPSNLLGQASILNPYPGQWNSVAIPGVQVTQGQQYWLALLGINGQIKFRDHSGFGGCYSVTSSQTGLTSLPASWWSGSKWSSCLVSLFGSGTTSNSISVTVSPSAASCQVSQQYQFTANVSGTSNTSVTWSTSGGSISSAGLYSAPSVAGTYTVKATSVADTSKSATATVTASTAVSLSVSPTSTSLPTGGQQQFSATVSGTSNTGVTWTASGGSISSGGLYTAPSSGGTYTVTATSVADATKSATATVTISTPVSVSVSPTSSSLPTGGQQQFSATVSGTSNTAVTWSASGGTVSTAGLYTSPSSAGTYTVKATSVADATKSATATVTVSTAVLVSVSPTSTSLQTGGQQQFSATVSGSSNTGVTWSASGGSISSAGLYTAPSAAGTSTVTATSVADATKSAAATVTVSSPISVSVSPTSTNLQTGGQQQFTAYVSGSSNTAVTWSSSGGTITTAGLYTAPSTAGSYTVQATSAADPTKSASASVAVTAQSISVTISPTSTSMPERWQQQFAATVSGTSNTGVTWAVTQGTGSITQTGLFTAPQVVETDVVTVTSQADSTKSASATVTTVAPHTVSLNWLPSTSSGISYYNVYRGTVNGGPYSLLKTSLTSTSFTDANVQSGSTYYYVTTAVDSAGAESTYSDQAQAVIPMP